MKNWDALLEATKERDAAYLRVLEIRKQLTEAEQQHQIWVGKVAELEPGT